MTNYDTFSSILAEIETEKSLTLALATLEDQEKIIRRCKTLNPEDRELLLSRKIPVLKEKLQTEIDKAFKSEQQHKKQLEEDDSHYDAVHNALYTESTDELLPTWEDLNFDDLPYPTWLWKQGLKEFFPLSHDILFRICACVALTNSFAVPGKSSLLTSEPELPLIYIYGLPGNSKSAFGDWVGWHYSISPDPRQSTFQKILDSHSLKGLRDDIDRACHRGGGRLREACIHLNDFRPEQLISGDWKQAHSALLGIQRSESVSTLSKNGKQNQEGYQDLFYMWALKIISTNNHPKELTSKLKGKFDRRIIPIPFDKQGEGLNEFSWFNLRQEYIKIWHGYEVKFVKQYLAPIWQRKRADFDGIPSGEQSRINQSRTLMAVGLFTGIFEDFNDARKCFAEYWEYANERTAKGFEDLFLSAVEQYVNTYETKHGRSLVSKVGQQKTHFEISQDELMAACSQQGSKERELKQLAEYMHNHGYQLDQQFKGGRFHNWYTKQIKQQ